MKEYNLLIVRCHSCFHLTPRPRSPNIPNFTLLIIFLLFSINLIYTES